MKNPRDITVIEKGYVYAVPIYEVTNEGVVEHMTPDPTVPGGFIAETRPIVFCKGNKANDSQTRQSGVFVESLIEVVKDRLTSVNVGELATRETSVAITKLEEALMWLEKRSADRKIRGVEQTYQK